MDKRNSGATFIAAILVSLMFFFSVGGLAADPLKKPENRSKITNLSRLLKSMDAVSATIDEKNKRLFSPEGQGREQSIRKDINELQQKYDQLEKSFNDLASEVNFDTIVNPEKSKGFNWNEELKEILGPLIREVQRATSKPREIEKLRSDIEAADFQLQNIERAMGHIMVLLDDGNTNPRLRDKLTQSLAVWEGRRNDVETAKSISNLQLEKIRKETESLAQAVQKIPSLFFKSHGRNLLLSMLALAAAAYSFYRFFFFIRRHSPFHKDEKSLYSRAFDLGYSVITGFLSLIVVLAVLYFCSDWVLLSIAILFLFGIAWTSKASLPRVWNQGRLILNLGPVREGELVVYNGIPYKVASINMYTLLYNPAIPSARIRLPITDLESLRSRPVDINEPWFPSRVGDWVLVEGDPERVGLIIAQTPETVLIEFAGGARLSVSSSNYLSATPLNLSSGFRARFLFGLDYDLQSRITKDIPSAVKQSVENGLATEGFKDALVAIRVDFKQAASSTLDLEISADFVGNAAGDYIQIKRVMQKSCVDACTENGWNIPFSQMTVHVADKHS
jgi:predicted  nucleic acid-binding Zn-ribbon protein